MALFYVNGTFGRFFLLQGSTSNTFAFFGDFSYLEQPDYILAKVASRRNELSGQQEVSKTRKEDRDRARCGRSSVRRTEERFITSPTSYAAAAPAPFCFLVRRRLVCVVSLSASGAVDRQHRSEKRPNLPRRLIFLLSSNGAAAQTCKTASFSVA